MSALAIQVTPSPSPPVLDVVAAVNDLLSLPDAELDYARAKVALDAPVDPGVDAEWVFAELDRLTDWTRRLARVGSALAKINAVRTVIYQSGPWNEGAPFGYDNFKNVRVKLLSHYLTSRRGNCVSMPILFLILADRLGLDVSLALAAQHVFVRWRNDDGKIFNLETTSGANPARDVWIKQEVGYSDRGVASGFYLRSLPRREGIATMALTVVEHLMEQQRYRDALAVAELIARHHPSNGLAWAHQGQAACNLIGAEYLDRYGSRWLIPSHARPEYLLLLQRNQLGFATARQLGWEPTVQPTIWRN